MRDYVDVFTENYRNLIPRKSMNIMLGFIETIEPSIDCSPAKTRKAKSIARKLKQMAELYQEQGIKPHIASELLVLSSELESISGSV